MSQSTPPSSMLSVGFVYKAHGLRGLLKIKLYNPLSDSFDHATHVYLASTEPSPSASSPYEVSYVQHAESGLLLVALTQIQSREAAEAVERLQVYVDKKTLPPLRKNEVYLSDLIGYQVFQEMNYLGKVSQVFSFGGRDLLEIESSSGAHLLIPMVPEIVRSIQKETLRITIDPPEGLLDINE